MKLNYVTSHAEVWIETEHVKDNTVLREVTSHAEVWIETNCKDLKHK